MTWQDDVPYTHTYIYICNYIYIIYILYIYLYMYIYLETPGVFCLVLFEKDVFLSLLQKGAGSRRSVFFEVAA